MKKSWLMSTLLSAGLFAGSATVALAQAVPGQNATASTGTGAATQAITLKPGQEMGTNTVQPVDTAGNPDASAQDARFALRASAGGMAEIMMGHLAMQRGQTQAERHFGQMLVTDHTQADQQLSPMAQTLMLRTASHPAHMQQAMYQQLASAPAGQFDDMFNQDMVAAHQETIALFKTESQSGQNPQLRQFAMMTLPALYRHLHVAEHLSPMQSANSGSMSGMATMGHSSAASDTMIHGNPDNSADQLNAQQLGKGNPS